MRRRDGIAGRGAFFVERIAVVLEEQPCGPRPRQKRADLACGIDVSQQDVTHVRTVERLSERGEIECGAGNAPRRQFRQPTQGEVIGGDAGRKVDAGVRRRVGVKPPVQARDAHTSLLKTL